MFATACEFSHGVAVNDGGTDSAVDALDATVIPSWTVDPTSGKATPLNAQEWTELASASALGIVQPNALWQMQESSGNLTDVMGSATLKPNGTPLYAQAVPGWTRVAIRTSDGDIGDRFFNTTDPSLPDVATTSITILLFYATASAPAQTRNVLFAGCCSTMSLAHLDVTASSQFRLTVSSSSAIGTATYGPEVVPILLQLDRTNNVQRVITDRETIDLPSGNLSSSRGIFIGSAGSAAPDGRWLYMAAWYGAAAEMDKATLEALVDALGW
jgi:hypothetical protein